jgi:hypothetical protein
MRPVIFVFAFFLAACSPPNGTGTGNPIMPTNGSAPDPTTGFPGVVSGEIFDQICSLISACNPSVSNDTCLEGIAPLTGFAPNLGIQLSPPPSAFSISQLEALDQITANPTVAEECTTKLKALTCTDSAVKSAYNPSAAAPFAGTVGLLDPVCAGVF